MRKQFIGVVLAWGLSACATTAHQTEAVLKEKDRFPESAQVNGVAFVAQSQYYCGPATLAMAMDFAGQPASAEALGEQVYTPGKQGSLQADMIAASRRRGMMAVQIYGMASLLRELAAGHPVVVLENQAFPWYPKWHYSIAIGYDLRGPDIVLHSGAKENWHRSMRRFERNWQYADYWGLVVLPPGELSVSATELEHSVAAAGLEQVGFLDKAEMSYHRILMRWPESLGALVGMGNIRFARGDRKEAVRYLRLAVKYHPESAAARHNLQVAEEAEPANPRKISSSRKPARNGID